MRAAAAAAAAVGVCLPASQPARMYSRSRIPGVREAASRAEQRTRRLARFFGASRSRHRHASVPFFARGHIRTHAQLALSPVRHHPRKLSASYCPLCPRWLGAADAAAAFLRATDERRSFARPEPLARGAACMRREKIIFLSNILRFQSRAAPPPARALSSLALGCFCARKRLFSGDAGSGALFVFLLLTGGGCWFFFVL